MFHVKQNKNRVYNVLCQATTPNPCGRLFAVGFRIRVTQFKHYSPISIMYYNLCSLACQYNVSRETIINLSL